MYKEKTICVVIPAYNEENQIGKVLDSMPDFVDYLVVINDKSTDNTEQIVKNIAENNSRLTLISHEKNSGVGASIASGYMWAKNKNCDVAAVMAGDGQMNPSNLESILLPVLNDEVDYAKGNRLFSGEAYKTIPKVRYFGNAILSMLTKIASGYWHITDSQSGYTAINKKALHLIDWDKMYKRYGQPNDLLVRLNVFDLKVRDIPIQPVYNVGETSGIRIRKVVFTISWLLLRLFLWRLKEKYIIRNFHPLVFFYFFGMLFFVATLVLFIRLFWIWNVVGEIPAINALAAMFSFMSATFFTLFAMWFDMETNKHLR